MENHVNHLTESHEALREKLNNNNLRHTRLFFTAFIETLNYRNSFKTVVKEELLSIFYSIFTAVYLQQANKISVLKQLKKGGYLPFHLDYQLIDDEYHALLHNTIENIYLNWAGTSISTYWLFDDEKPTRDDNEDIYKYFDLEIDLYNGFLKKIEEETLLLDHLHYVWEKLNADRSATRSINWRKACYNIDFKYYEKFLKNYNNSDKTFYMLQLINEKFSFFNSSLHADLFSVLKQVYNVDKLSLEGIEDESLKINIDSYNEIDWR